MEQYTSEFGTNTESLRQLTDAAQLRDVMQVVMRTLPVVQATEQSTLPYLGLFHYAYSAHRALIASLVNKHAYIPKLITQRAAQASKEYLDSEMLEDLEQEGILALVQFMQHFDPRIVAESVQEVNVKMRAYSKIQYKMARKYSEEIGVRYNKRPLHEIVQTEEDVSLRYGLYPPQEAIGPLDVDNETLIQEVLQGIINGTTYTALIPHERSVMESIYRGTTQDKPVLHGNALVKLKQALLR